MTMPQASKRRLPQTALITGATSGIGEALCHLLASKGFDLLITGRNTEQLERLKKTLSAQVKVIAFQADLASHEGTQYVIKQIHEHVPDVVINNAGFGLYGEALSHPIEEQLKMLDVNSNVPLALTLETAKIFQEKKKQGIILNVASAAAFNYLPYHAVYAAAKSCVVSFSQALDLELEPHGIRVLVSCPGVVATDFSRRAMQPLKRSPKSIKGAMSSEFAAEEIWQQIQTGKRCHIFDWRYRVGVFLSHFIPSSWVAKIVRSVLEKRKT